jgi:hypothetical protein
MKQDKKNDQASNDHQQQGCILPSTTQDRHASIMYVHSVSNQHEQLLVASTTTQDRHTSNSTMYVHRAGNQHQQQLLVPSTTRDSTNMEEYCKPARNLHVSVPQSERKIYYSKVLMLADFPTSQTPLSDIMQHNQRTECNGEVNLPSWILDDPRFLHQPVYEKIN